MIDVEIVDMYDCDTIDVETIIFLFLYIFRKIYKKRKIIISTPTVLKFTHFGIPTSIISTNN